MSKPGVVRFKVEDETPDSIESILFSAGVRVTLQMHDGYFHVVGEPESIRAAMRLLKHYFHREVEVVLEGSPTTPVTH